jgi:hypothetical protein
VTFTARAIAENPLEYHSFTTRMAQHPFWHAYVHPHTLGLLRDWTEEKDEVLRLVLIFLRTWRAS